MSNMIECTGLVTGKTFFYIKGLISWVDLPYEAILKARLGNMVVYLSSAGFRRVTWDGFHDSLPSSRFLSELSAGDFIEI